MAELHARLRQTDILAWPASVQAMAWRMPLLSLPVEKTAEGVWTATGPVPDTAPANMMPKLTIKSWQETGRLRMIPAGQPLAPAVRIRLASPTAQHLTVLKAWDDAADPPCLHLFEWTDMSRVSEARYLCLPGSTRQTSLCHRTTKAPAKAAADPLIQAVRSGMPGLEGFILQIALPPDGPPRILDINPALSASDLAALAA